MNMAQVRKYKTSGSLPTNKWSYKGKEYEVSGEDLKMLNDWKMNEYQFDPVLPEGYNGVPEGKDVLAKKLGLITEEQYNSKYTPKTDPIAASTITAEKPQKGPKGSRYFIDNVEQDRDELLKYLHNTLQTDLWSVIDSDKNNNHDYHNIIHNLFFFYILFAILPPFYTYRIGIQSITGGRYHFHLSPVCHQLPPPHFIHHQQMFKTSSKSVNGLGTNSSRGLN